jgi:type II secretory pathway component GspD/PulD (secretin)
MKMTKLVILGCLVIFVLAFVSPGWSETKEVKAIDTSKEALSGVIVTLSVDWADKPLRDALKYIADKSGMNIVSDNTITDEDRITVAFHNLEWRKALGEVARLTGCVIEEIGNDLIRCNKPPRVKMDFKNAPIDEVIRAIAKLANVNIIIADDVKGGVTMTLSEVPWMDALEGIVKTAGFTIVKEDHNVIRVVKAETLTEQLETRIFKLKYLKPPETYTAKIDTSYAVGAPKPTQDAIKEFTLLDILKGMLTTHGGKTIGMLEYDIKTNAIIVKDIKTVLDDMQKVLDKLDVEPGQVFIEVKYVSTSNEDLLNFGIDYAWGDRSGLTMETVPKEGSKASPVQTRLPFMMGHASTSHTQSFLNSYEVNATLRLFKKDIKSKLSQVPSLVALDGRVATIFVGESIHYAQTTASTNQYGGIEYAIAEAGRSPAKVGFQLLVVAYIIKENNQVMMTVIPQDEFLTGTTSLLTGFERFSVRSGDYEQYIDLPRIKQSVAVTNLIVESGMTAVVGGLAIDRARKTVNKVPFVCDIPLLGELFKYTEDVVTKDHLIIFITPRILRNTQDVTDAMKRKLEDQDKK